MKLTINNFDGQDARDYTSAVDAERPPRVRRRLNRPSELRVWLVASTPDFVVPANGGRVVLSRESRGTLFTGYISAPPQFEYLGWGQCGPMYRYAVVATSDEFLLDRPPLPSRAPFVGRTAGGALKQLMNDLHPGAFDSAGVQDLCVVPSYSVSPQKSWSEHAGEIALRARACYRAHQGAITLARVGDAVFTLDENSPDYSAEGLMLENPKPVTNDVTVTGRIEPSSHVKDYFLGDGYALGFDLAEVPFMRFTLPLVEEEYREGALRPTHWNLADPTAAVSVSAGKLRVEGGAGDGQTVVQFADLLELGGALVLQHGDCTFSGASSGVLGGLYSDGIATASCLAGFRVLPSGSESVISAVVNGVPAGASMTTVAGHRYVLTTRVYASEVYRAAQPFHSSLHAAGAGRTNPTAPASIRLVLEVHDIDPANPASIAAASTVLFDDIISDAPAHVTYGLVNATGMHCEIAFTRLLRAMPAQVRSMVPGQPWRTRLAGALSEGGECKLTDRPELRFYAPYVPVANEQIVVSYRAGRRAVARVTDPASMAALANGDDDGARALMRSVLVPPPRTSAECEQAALALLDDSTLTAWAGSYETWNDFLPQAADDIFPGDALQVNAPSRDAVFTAVVREVEIEVADLSDEHARYRIRFANDAAEPLGFESEAARLSGPIEVTSTTATAGSTWLADLNAAEVTQITSTTVSIDAGGDPPPGGGIEVRRSDVGWSAENDRNLLGRFVTRAFTLPRISRVQEYYLRQYDATSPPRYSRNAALLHIDWPL